MKAEIKVIAGAHWGDQPRSRLVWEKSSIADGPEGEHSEGARMKASKHFVSKLEYLSAN